MFLMSDSCSWRVFFNEKLASKAAARLKYNKWVLVEDMLWLYVGYILIKYSFCCLSSAFLASELWMLSSCISCLMSPWRFVIASSFCKVKTLVTVQRRCFLLNLLCTFPISKLHMSILRFISCKLCTSSSLLCRAASSLTFSSWISLSDCCFVTENSCSSWFWCSVVNFTASDDTNLY